MVPSLIFKLALQWAGQRYEEGVPAEELMTVMEFALWVEALENEQIE